MAGYLQTRTLARSQYRTTRREALSGGIVVHTTESTPDVFLPDGGAEAVASWMTRRTTPGSYHALFDSDSTVELVDIGSEAFHVGTDGANRHTVGISFACHAHQWRTLPDAWVDGALDQAARYILDVAIPAFAEAGIDWRPDLLDRADIAARRPGITTHALMDPSRRSDPGADFPWDRLLARLAHLDTATPETKDDPDPMAYLIFYVERAYRHAGRNPDNDPTGVDYWLQTTENERPGHRWDPTSAAASPTLAKLASLLVEHNE